MLTVWSWEADSEVLIERSVGEEKARQAAGRPEQSSAVPRCPPQPALSPRELPASGLCSEPSPKKRRLGARCLVPSTLNERPPLFGHPGDAQQADGLRRRPALPGRLPAHASPRRDGAQQLGGGLASRDVSPGLALAQVTFIPSLTKSDDIPEGRA